MQISCHMDLFFGLPRGKGEREEESSSKQGKDNLHGVKCVYSPIRRPYKKKKPLNFQIVFFDFLVEGWTADL